MRQNKRTWLALLLALIIALGLLPATAAADTPQSAAQNLYELGLFRGVGEDAAGRPDFDLNARPDRAQAVTMLVRLMGAEEAALTAQAAHPFTDVPQWVSPYVGYAYQMGWTLGVGGGRFGAGEPVTDEQYLTFLLRALGYDSSRDFAWDQAHVLAGQIGLIRGDYGRGDRFCRGDVAQLSYWALTCQEKSGGRTLVQALIASGAVEEETARRQGLLDRQTQADTLQITFLDVGQADCIWLSCGGQNMLIDAGNRGDGADIVAYLRGQGVERLDVLLATHAHADHIGGMAEVVRQMEIGQVYLSDQPANTQTYENLLDALLERGHTVSTPRAGDTISLGGATVQVVGPVQHYSEMNNSSLVLRVCYGGSAALLTGDMEADAEQDLLQSGAYLQAGVLKVGHHGSDTSTSAAFLQAVAPDVAVISVGQGNSYGHPSQAVLDRLAQYGAAVYRTDERGSIRVETDGDGWRVIPTR